MTEEPKKKSSPPAKRGGLGRGLGALIPSAPLGNASGKGHFWSALDNPPAVDDDVKKRIVDDIVSRGDSAHREHADGESPGQEATGAVSRETVSAQAYPPTVDPAVDITVDNWPPADVADAPATPANGEHVAAAREATVVPSASAAREPGRSAEEQSSREDDAESDTVQPLTDQANVTTPETSDDDSGVASRQPEDGTNVAATDPAGSSDPAGEVMGTGPIDDVSRETPARTPGDGRGAGGQVPAVLVELSPAEIRANPKNPRQVFDDDELSELAESIKEFGLLQPIVARETADGYELVMGERRLRASRLAGLDSIPVLVRQTDDDEMLRDALLENIHRVQLHPLEEAAAYQQLIDEFGVTHEELAQRIKRSRPVISNTIRLLKLPARVQNRVAAGVISGSHARALLGLDDHDAQEALANRIVAEGLSVRATEEAVAMHVGDGSPTRRAARRKRPTAPALVALADRLSDHFDTRALVQLGRTKGKIVVEFASVDDLERIIAMMAPPLATVKDAAVSADADTAGSTESDSITDPQ